MKTSHHLTNVTVSFPSADAATVNAYVQAWHWKADNTVVVAPGTWDAELVRVDGQWLIAKGEARRGRRRRDRAAPAACGQIASRRAVERLRGGARLLANPVRFTHYRAGNRLGVLCHQSAIFSLGRRSQWH